MLKKEGTIFREIYAHSSRKSTASLNAVRLHWLHRNRGIVRLIKCCTVCIKFSAQKSRFCGCVRPALNAVRTAINFSTEIEVRPAIRFASSGHEFRGRYGLFCCCTVHLLFCWYDFLGCTAALNSGRKEGCTAGFAEHIFQTLR